MDVSSLLIPLLLTAAALWALGHRMDVYDALTAGAAEGLTVLLRIVPSLIALLTAVYMFRASGALALLARVLSPVLEALGIPPETAALLLVRPVSGSGALAVGSELMAAPDLTTFLAANEDNFSSASAVARLNEMLEKKGLSKAALAKQSGMSEIYLHQIFAGRRNPSRSRMLCLCFGLSASLEETQELLRLCGLAELYPKVRRDAIIIYGLLHGMDLFAVNDRLFSEDEETLF